MKRVFTLIFVCVSVIASVSPAFSETIYLKSGEKVIGKIIVSQSPKSMVLQDASGACFSYSLDEIREVQKDDAAEEPAAKKE